MNPETTPKPRVLPILFATLLIDMIGFGMVIPIIPVLFTDPTSPSFLLHGYSQGMQFFLAGVLTALWGVTQFIAAPIAGELSDVFGRKRLLLGGVGVLALSQVLFGVGVEMGSLALLFVSRAIAGVAAGNAAIAQATIADVTSPKDRAKSFGFGNATQAKMLLNKTFDTQIGNMLDFSTVFVCNLKLAHLGSYAAKSNKAATLRRRFLRFLRSSSR